MKSQFCWLVLYIIFTRFNSYAQGYQLVWSDEFNGAEIDEKRWFDHSFEWWTPTNNEKYPYLTPGENTKIEDGNLVLSAHILDEPYHYNGLSLTRSGALMYTRQRFKYGYFEMRFRSHKGSGLVSSLWLFPTYATKYDEGWDEIDLLEIAGHTGDNLLHLGVIAKEENMGGQQNNGDFTLKCEDGRCIKWKHHEEDYSFGDDFHTIAVDWDENGIAYFLDGKQIGYAPYHYNTSMEIVLSLVPTDNIDWGGLAPAQFEKNTLEIDYVRVWKKASCTENVSKCEYLADPYHFKRNQSVLAGKHIELGSSGGTECLISVEQHGHPYWIGNEHLHAYALGGNGSVTLKPGFHARETGDFIAKVKPCISAGKLELPPVKDMALPQIKEVGDGCINMFKGYPVDVNKYFYVKDFFSQMYEKVIYEWMIEGTGILSYGKVFQVPIDITPGNFKVLCRAIYPDGVLESSKTFDLYTCEEYPYALYPNPAHDVLNIKIDEEVEKAQVRITDAYSLVYINGAFNVIDKEVQLDVSTLPKQMYICTVITKTEKYVGHLIIE